MVSERMRRNLDAFLDAAEEASLARDWPAVSEHARAALAIEAENADALTFLRMAEANLSTPALTSTPAPEAPAATPVPAATPQPESFAAGRYHVRRFLGEGGKKRVFLAHDQLLDRDVAFALIKTEGLDATSRERITREAQAMGRMGSHPHVVSIYDIGEEGGAPFVVTELMSGGDVEGELTKAEGALPLARALEIGKGVARGLAFAHAQGIVHRDLKPGNVWLTRDGVAKIGDFGLAVALNRSRLTLHGLMVGTVAYMPPEQALGGEVTPQADLYSLGAMLYELVTGKPPFQGDTPTAVISQHMNSTPVAPSWNSEHCPPALEALILHLLAKVPADRPASANAVLAALDAVDPNAPTASHSDSQANPLDRLARGVFVGRERELERLRSAFDGALAGRGSLVMLVGEPGIGKTRTTLELETYARMRGAKVLWGRAHEAAGAPPYWPWVQVARAYRELTPDDEVRRKQYEPYAVELQRIFTALPALFPNLPPPDADSQEGQFRLYDALSSFLRTVATETPLVVVLDDLHWADGATLAMLTHVTRELGRARVLVLGTYRDTDLDRRHPLSQALAEMNREDLFQRIGLHGLGESEVRDYIARAAGLEPSRDLAHRVFEETEGNPFFLSEVVNLMAQEGTLTAGARDVTIPEGVRQALGRRLDRLSEEANALLTTLAVAGREFDHALVRAIGGHDEQTTLHLIEEALAARVLEEIGAVGAYRFTHALMQETLLAELSAARRVLLHGQIAQAFESLYGPDNHDHLAALANHYAESAVLNRDHARAAVRYLRLAAEQSMAAFAWDDATRYYQRCLTLTQSEPDHFGLDEAALSAMLSTCALRTYDYRTHWRAALTALGGYRERADWVAFARVAIAIPVVTTPSARMSALLEEARDGLGSEGHVLLRATLGIRMVELAGVMGYEGMATLLRETGQLVAEAGDPVLLAIFTLLDVWPSNLGDLTLERAEAVEAALTTIGAQSSGIALAGYTQLSGIVWGGLGDIDRAITGARRHQELRQRYRLNTDSAVGWLADLYLVRGELDACRAVIEDHRDGTHPVLRATFVRLAELTGDFDEAVSCLPDPALFRSIPWTLAFVEALRARTLWRAGQFAQAQRAAAQVDEALAACHDTPVAVSEALANLDEAGPVLASPRLISLLRTRFPRIPGLVGLQANAVLSGRFRGDWALYFGDLDGAEQNYAEALEVARRERLPIEEGRTLQGLANLAERRGDVETARAHLDSAGELFAKHGVKLYLDQVLAKKQLLKA